MTYVVNDKCIKCKLTDCVEVCPVDCFYEGNNMLVINPEECIDCGLCEPTCPIGAIQSEDDDGAMDWMALNKKYSSLWPSITIRKDPEPEYQQFVDMEDKYEKYFCENLD